MKKLLLIVGFMVLICSISEASKVRVWILPDKSIRHTVCSKNVMRETCIADVIKANPKLQGLEHEDIKKEEMPDIKLGNKDRETWEKKKGESFVINKIKEKILRNKKVIEARVKKIKNKSDRQKAIDELKAESAIPGDYVDN